ncbi:hypothetical protein STENM327S_04885 [Streptomyces tendae]
MLSRRPLRTRCLQTGKDSQEVTHTTPPDSRDGCGDAAHNGERFLERVAPQRDRCDTLPERGSHDGRSDGSAPTLGAGCRALMTGMFYRSALLSSWAR